VLVLLVALLIWKPWRPSPPRLNEEPYKIARFAASSAMDDTPWSMQREYMDILDKKEDALLEAYKAGRLSDIEYRRSLQLGWYDKHLDRMEKFYERPPGRRMEYIDSKVLGKKFKEIAKNPGKNAGKGEPAGKKPKNEDKSDDLSALKPEEVDRDDSTEEQDIKRWPADVKQKWLEYRKAVAERKEFYKERERLAKEARKSSATHPSTAPGTTGTATTGGAAGGTDAGASTAPRPADSAQ